MSTEEYWRLTITLSEGCNLSLIGEEAEFREVIKNFCEGGTFGKVLISGISDTADRAPLVVAVDFENVKALTLEKLWG